MTKLSFLTRQLDAIQSDKLWMGDSFLKKIETIDEPQAFEQPLGYVHSVAQILAHLSAWKEDALLKLRNGKGELMDSDPKNWPTNVELKALGWNEVLKRFKESHTALINELNLLNDDIFDKTYYDQDFKGEYPMSFMLEGLLHHDLYHLGQIGLIIGLNKNRK